MESKKKYQIKEADKSDLKAVLYVEKVAFGYEKEAELVNDLLGDPTAKPIISLLAFDDDEPVGHILLTKVILEGDTSGISAMILAPLAVIPEAQNKGVGGALIREALRQAAQQNIGLVFVLGHPDYYPRHGFRPAGHLGLDAPYPIPPENAGAWMVMELRPGLIDSAHGVVKCAATLDRPEHWRE
jgi:putative acetyltransferase